MVFIPSRRQVLFVLILVVGRNKNKGTQCLRETDHHNYQLLFSKQLVYLKRLPDGIDTASWAYETLTEPNRS